MSVINKMLKDLDDRQHTHGMDQVPKVQLQYQSPPKSSNGVKLIGLSVASLFVGAAAVVGYQYWQGNLDLSSVSSSQVAQQNSSDAPARINEPAALQLSDNDAIESTVEQVSSAREGNRSSQVKPVMSDDVSSPANQSVVSNVQPPKTAVAQSAPIQQKPFVASTSVKKTAAKRGSSQQQSIAAPSKPTAKMAVKEVRLSSRELGQKSLKVAQQAEKQGRLEEAISAYIKTLTLDASNHQTRKQLAALYYGRNQLNQASTVLTQGLVLYPDYVEFSLLLSRVQQAAGAYPQAIETLSDISDFGEFARQKWLQQTDLAQKVQDNVLAELAYRNLVRAEPNQGRWWMGLAHALDSQKKYDDAKAAYSFALSKSGLSTQAVGYIEKRLNQLGDR